MASLSELSMKLRLRLIKRRRRLRAWRLGRRLSLVQDNLHNRQKGAVTAYIVVRNEAPRLLYFLNYYRKLGVGHFIFINNGSTDKTQNLLNGFDDVSVYFTKQSYKKAHYGMDWVNYLLNKHSDGEWALIIDADEFLIFPYFDTRPLPALVDYLQASRQRTLSAQLLDFYPVSPDKIKNYNPKKSPFEVLTHFDIGNYSYKINPMYKNLWIQGGVRMRLFFANNPNNAPALNKIPLIKWKKSFCYISSTHQLLPVRLNEVYRGEANDQVSGAILHTKFLPDLQQKIENPFLVDEHYSDGREYRSYHKARVDHVEFRTKTSLRFRGWRQLESLGIISHGGWG